MPNWAACGAHYQFERHPSGVFRRSVTTYILVIFVALMPSKNAGVMSPKLRRNKFLRHSRTRQSDERCRPQDWFSHFMFLCTSRGIPRTHICRHQSRKHTQRQQTQQKPSVFSHPSCMSRLSMLMSSVMVIVCVCTAVYCVWVCLRLAMCPRLVVCCL